eukprot:1363228-Amphidinium_carterae.3
MSDIDGALEGTLPTALRKLHARLSKDVELYKLHVRHYHMRPNQFRKRTSELALPEYIYKKYDNVCKECKVRQKLQKPFPRSRVSGVRATRFGDVVFLDHATITFGDQTVLVLLVLDGASGLLWWMANHHCKPRWVVADMAFFTPDWRTFWITNGVQMLPTGARTPWPNRAETAVRLFKQRLSKVCEEARTDKSLALITARDAVRECCWARNTQLAISGYSPVELATGRRPPDQLDLELLTPEQLSTTPLRADETIAHLRRLSIKSHFEVELNQDIKRDLARRLQPSDGPSEPGERVFVWIQDSSKFKDRGRWEPGPVVGQEGAMVRVEVKDRV